MFCLFEVLLGFNFNMTRMMSRRECLAFALNISGFDDLSQTYIPILAKMPGAQIGKETLFAIVGSFYHIYFAKKMLAIVATRFVIYVLDR